MNPKHTAAILVGGATLLAVLSIAAPALADDGQGQNEGHGHAEVHAGLGLKFGHVEGKGRGIASTTLASLPKGNGQPVIAGTVSAISGSTVTVGTAAGINYTVNASGAAIVKGLASSTLGSVAVGDKVVVQGSISGTSVTATTIFDQAAKIKPAPQGTTTPTTTPEKEHENKGLHIGQIFGGVGNFFHSLFGFF